MSADSAFVFAVPHPPDFVVQVAVYSPPKLHLGIHYLLDRRLDFIFVYLRKVLSLDGLPLRNIQLLNHLDFRLVGFLSDLSWGHLHLGGRAFALFGGGRLYPGRYSLSNLGALRKLAVAYGIGALFCRLVLKQAAVLLVRLHIPTSC